MGVANDSATLMCSFKKVIVSIVVTHIIMDVVMFFCWEMFIPHVQKEFWDFVLCNQISQFRKFFRAEEFLSSFYFF